MKTSALFGTAKERELILFLYFTGFAVLTPFLSLGVMVAIQLSNFARSAFFMALPFRYVHRGLFHFGFVRFDWLAYEPTYLPTWGLGLALVAATIGFIDDVYLAPCCHCLAFWCSLSRRSHMFEAVVVKHSIEEAKLYETASR
ncbi:hypothetical protein RHSIM_Rhsim05G0189000 [Rhododendron simsii]|uniref:Uncharacterized protein n=1 Tax=Rhododendron simsii TaxID=118357 RepID=A0A834H705_RHOSS|nr:hypothetical protein RHSIM_Rhsim05G0189000 [Rhododendron simsii]